MASVQITPTRPDRVAATARRAAGRITSTTGTAYRSRASRSTAALAELQAITRALTPWSTRWSRHSSAYSRTLGDRLLAVRGAGGVAEIDDVLVRQLVDHRPGDGQPAEAGVEDADRRLVSLPRPISLRRGAWSETVADHISRKETTMTFDLAHRSPTRWPGIVDGVRDDQLD